MYTKLFEPFAGSACYATRHHEHEVTLVEKDPDIAWLWQWLINANPNEIADLPARRLEEGQDIRDIQVSYGAQLLIRQWQRVGMSTCWFVSKWCNKPGQWSPETRDYVAASVEKIRHWKILCGDALLLDNARATWFIDLPYEGLSLYGSRLMPYARLAQWCKTRAGQVIVCEQASATWLPFQPFRKQVTGRRGKASKGPSKEGIWTNESG